MPRISPLYLLDKDLVVQTINKSSTFAEILTKLGFPKTGGWVKSIKRIAKSYGCCLKHIKTGLATNKGRKHPRIDISKHLVQNSTVSRSFIKRRLIADGLLQNTCSECGLSLVWNNKPIILVLDHINGIHNDYRLNNLRLLCPNCNSQTETFAGRNKKYKTL